MGHEDVAHFLDLRVEKLTPVHLMHMDIRPLLHALKDSFTWILGLFSRSQSRKADSGSPDAPHNLGLFYIDIR